MPPTTRRAEAPANGAAPPPLPEPAELHRQLVDARPVTRAPEPPPAAAPLRVRVQPAEPGADGRPRAPKREVEVAIPGYPGFLCWVWSNFPQRLRDELTSGDGDRIRAALCRLVVEHNGWCDADGEPYPPASDPAFWNAIPTELGSLLSRAIREAPDAFPNSLNATDGR